jgi:hypothetical protein
MTPTTKKGKRTRAVKRVAERWSPSKPKIRHEKKVWAMFLAAYYPVFVGAFEGVQDAPPVNHALAKMFEDSGQTVLWEEATVIYSLPSEPYKPTKRYWRTPTTP